MATSILGLTFYSGLTGEKRPRAHNLQWVNRRQASSSAHSFKSFQDFRFIVSKLVAAP